MIATQQELTGKRKKLLTRGFLFACTNASEEECLNGLLFATEKSYGPVVIRIRKGDLLFLNNIDTDTLYGVFKAVSDGGFNLSPDAFQGRYPFQVKVGPLAGILRIQKAKSLLKKYGFGRNVPLYKDKLGRLLESFLPENSNSLVRWSPKSGQVVKSGFCS